MFKNAAGGGYHDDDDDQVYSVSSGNIPGMDKEGNITDPIKYLNHHYLHGTDPKDDFLPKGATAEDLKGVDPVVLLTDFGKKSLDRDDIELLGILQSAQVEQRRLAEEEKKPKRIKIIKKD
jgi:hypothetical protein